MHLDARPRIPSAGILCACLIACMTLTACRRAPEFIGGKALKEKSQEVIFVAAETEVFAEFVLHGQVPSTARQQHCLYLSQRLEQAIPRDARAESGLRQQFATLSQLSGELHTELLHLQQSDDQRSVEEVRRSLANVHSQLSRLKESL